MTRKTTPPRRPGGRLGIALGLSALVAAGSTALSVDALAQVNVEPAPTPKSLRGVPVPEPSNLYEFVANKAEAIALGKALFWDTQVGSDGKTACGTCHFHAGADSRSRNQISPGLNRMANGDTPSPDFSFQLSGPNSALRTDQFPLHKLSDPANRNSAVLRTLNDVISSAGASSEQFNGVTGAVKPGGTIPTATRGTMPTDPYANWYASSTEQRAVKLDSVFHVGSSNTRQVEPRNTPTVINAVFHLRNFWDGRAEWVFNGVNPFGLRDPNARVMKNITSASGAQMTPVSVRIENASLASQASGPPLSALEMSAAGRTFSDTGKKLLYLRPLQFQRVSDTDGVLGARRHASGLGLSDANYATMVQRAFRPEWWNGSSLIQVSSNGSVRQVPISSTPAPNEYTHMQYNFALFFGLALQLYQATLVSDDSPFDRHMAGSPTALSNSAKLGLSVFYGKGKCANCHGGAEFTNASVGKLRSTLLSRMIMGDGGQAVYDEGYYNIGVRPTFDDIGVGGKDPYGNPLSWSAVAQQGASRVTSLLGFPANLTVAPGERIARMGAFKVPTLRNVELTGPYFHNGDSLTLRQVVEFYNRGGNFADQNRSELDTDISPLNLHDEEKLALVEFMKSLTDDRVRFARAPFDRPELPLIDGHQGDDRSVTDDGSGRSSDQLRTIAAVGRTGVTAVDMLPNFLNSDFSDQPTVEIRTASGRCIGSTPAATITSLTMTSVSPCNGQSHQRFKIWQWEEGSKLLKSLNGAYIDSYGGSNSPFSAVWVAPARGSMDQQWRLEDLGNGLTRIRNRAGLCISNDGQGTSLRIQSCTVLTQDQAFTLVRVGS